MKKKIVVISSSPHKISNSELLALEFMKGAKENGNEVELIQIKNMDLKFCKGCLACQKLHRCVIKDDFNKTILMKLCNADVLVFATPVYYYSVCGQLKTFIDRMNPLYAMEYKYRDIYLISTAAEDSNHAFRGVKECIKGFTECYPKTKIKASICIGGLDNGGDVKCNEKALKRAYKLGQSVK